MINMQMTLFDSNSILYKIKRGHILLFIFFLSCNPLPEAILKKPNVSGYFDSNKFIVINDFIFDTGASHSVFFLDSINILIYQKYFYKKIHLKDSSGKNEVNQSLLFDSLNIGNLTVNNAFFFTKNKESLPSVVKNYNGIIGMNLIGKANWLFDMKNNTFTVLDKDSLFNIPNQHLILKYKLSNNIPYTSITIGHKTIDDVLIDTGAANSWFDLSMENLKYLNNLYDAKSIDTLSAVGIHNIKTTLLEYTYENVNIANYTMDYVRVGLIQKPQKQLLGYEIIKKFNYIFINSEYEYICLFN